MELGFRWYGETDPVILENIRQIPNMKQIVSALYDVPVGKVWPLSKIKQLKQRIEAHCLTFETVESVPVHEDIKLGLPSRDRWIKKLPDNAQTFGKCWYQNCLLQFYANI